ncbi:MAG: cytochrome C oxidase subunit IV family protein [Burkholderiaceae bacterium]|nr:MAG: cytochrome C oxidase subunit IV family protein [Burkholderiaceae bacterium]
MTSATATTRRRIDTIWAALLCATALTWWLGESGAAVRAGLATACAVLGLSALKGTLIVLDYMELRHAPALWRRLLLGWLAAVVLVLLGASAWHVRLFS